MTASTHKEKRAAPVARRAHLGGQAIGPVQHAQRTEIHDILRSTGAQAKLTVGAPNDKYEQEADRVADRVMRMSDADVAQRVESGRIQPMQIQRMCPECEEEQALQRQPIEEEEEELQAKEIPGQTPIELAYYSRSLEDYGCGEFSWWISWDPKGVSDSVNGFIVQKTMIERRLAPCPEDPKIPPKYSEPFWEAWKVQNGKIYINKSVESRDHWDGKFYPGHNGYLRYHGYAKFVDGTQDPQNWPQGQIPEAGDLHATRTKPAWWSDSGVLYRWVKSDFSCCGRNRKYWQTSLTCSDKRVKVVRPLRELEKFRREMKLLRRQPIEGEEDELKMKIASGRQSEATPDLESRINVLRSRGQSLDPATRSFFERRFGHDFSQVRVNTDTNASEAAKSVNARAFTLGNNVVFSSGEYQPQSKEGKRLLGHELTHVVQQSGGSALCLAGKKSEHTSPNLPKLNIVFPGLLSGFDRVQRKSPIRQPGEVIAEAEAFPAEATAELERRRLAEEARSTDPEKSIELVLAKASAETEVEKAVRTLIDTYRHALSVAGDDTRKQRQAQEDFLDAVGRVRESYKIMFDMQVRWGIEFDYGTKQVYFSAQEGVSRYAVYAWSKKELDIIDGILQRIPSTYLSRQSQRIKKIQRGGSEGATGASWNKTTSTITIYDQGFKDPAKVAEIILHEVGHGTVTERTVAGVGKLPPEDWMKLSDWKATPRASVASELSLSMTEASDLLDKLDARKASQSNIFRDWLEIVNGRKVVFNKYEGIGPCENLLHYATAHDSEFVSDYARVHPAEDLAESFTYYLLEPSDTKNTLNAGKKGDTDKWDYLVAHYPDKLRKKR